MAPQEIAMDANTAERDHYKIGETIGAIVRSGEQKYRIAGIAKFGSVSSIGGATLAVFNFPVAQALFGKAGKLDKIYVAAKPGVTPAQVLRQVKTILPPHTQARTSQAQAQESAEGHERLPRNHSLLPARLRRASRSSSARS